MIIKKNLGSRLHEQIKSSEFYVINKCGHLPHEEKPIQTFHIINNFLNTIKNEY